MEFHDKKNSICEIIGHCTLDLSFRQEKSNQFRRGRNAPFLLALIKNESVECCVVYRVVKKLSTFNFHKIEDGLTLLF